ncbi:hypothetical protein Hanom_Chr14g01282781 [Helianthus anomalus]
MNIKSLHQKKDLCSSYLLPRLPKRQPRNLRTQKIKTPLGSRFTTRHRFISLYLNIRVPPKLNHM